MPLKSFLNIIYYFTTSVSSWRQFMNGFFPLHIEWGPVKTSFFFILFYVFCLYFLWTSVFLSMLHYEKYGGGLGSYEFFIFADFEFLIFILGDFVGLFIKFC